MTRNEKEQFSARMAAVFAPPDKAFLETLQREEPVLFPNEEISLDVLQKDYIRLFSDPYEGKISLVESTYKPWTVDKTCPLGFSAEKGLLMGDCALHIQNIFQALSLSVPPDFQGTPDHLVLELELLSHLYRFASGDQIRQFIEDHLDWVPDLRDEVQKADPGFYGWAVERLLDFLKEEIHLTKETKHEAQNLH
jgi:TorA maturation chaperone TorD